MIEPPIEFSIPVKEKIKEIYVSNDGKMIVGGYSHGYMIIRENSIIKRTNGISKIQLIKSRNILAVSVGNTMNFYNSNGTLLWHDTFNDDIIDFFMQENHGIILFKGKVRGIGNFKSKIWEIKCREDAYKLLMDATGKYFLVVAKNGIDFYTFNPPAKLWGREMLNEIYDFVIHRNGGRIGITLKSGDFYLLNKNGKNVLEYRFKNPSLLTFDFYGNIVIGNENNIKMMNSKGTVLRAINIEGKCKSLSSSTGADYVACGTTSGRVYFFDSNGVLWNYKHSKPIECVDTSSLGEYVVSANMDILFFNNLSYYLSLLRDVEKKISSIGTDNPQGLKLIELYKKMKNAYLKKDLDILNNFKRMFDSAYENIKVSKLKYAILLDKIFEKDKISKNFIFILGKYSKIRVYGDVKYSLVPSKIDKKGNVKYTMLLQPKGEGEIKIKIEIETPEKKISIPFTIMADGKMRKKRVISNTNYKEFIA